MWPFREFKDTDWLFYSVHRWRLPALPSVGIDGQPLGYAGHVMVRYVGGVPQFRNATPEERRVDAEDQAMAGP